MNNSKVREREGSYKKTKIRASLVVQMVKNLPAMQETWVQSLGWEDPLEEGMATHSSILAPGNPHGQRSLVGPSPWDHKELDTTERLSTQIKIFLLFADIYKLN